MYEFLYCLWLQFLKYFPFFYFENFKPTEKLEKKVQRATIVPSPGFTNYDDFAAFALSLSSQVHTAPDPSENKLQTCWHFSVNTVACLLKIGYSPK